MPNPYVRNQREFNLHHQGLLKKKVFFPHASIHKQNPLNLSLISIYANDVLITGLRFIIKHSNKHREKNILCIVLIQLVNNHLWTPPPKEAEK